MFSASGWATMTLMKKSNLISCRNNLIRAKLIALRGAVGVTTNIVYIFRVRDKE